jgi:hypothetical protein
MRTAIGYFVAIARYAEISVSIGQAYRTKKPCVALRFNPAGKPEIVFLPQGAILRVIQPSYCVREGVEVVFGEQVYEVFKVDLLTSERPWPSVLTESKRVTRLLSGDPMRQNCRAQTSPKPHRCRLTLAVCATPHDDCFFVMPP